MEVYESDREQVEALKKWWKDNGRSVVLGVVLGLGGVFGWRWWQGHQHQQAVQASALYQQLAAASELGDQERAGAFGEALIGAHPRSLYGSLAALTLADQAVATGDLAQARRQLEWVADNSPVDGLKPVATVRLARVLLAQGAPDQALALLEAPAPDSFRAAYAELRGDILVEGGEREAAREAYREALGALDATAPNRSLVQLKLDDLGAAPGSAPASETGS